MFDISNIPELILPAGNLEKLKYAFAYGADAVYVGPPELSLRANLNEFDVLSIKKAIQYAHKLGKKLYVTLNLFAHEEDLKMVEKTAKEIAEEGPDAFIVSDPGVLRILKRELGDIIPFHLSTQSNTTNSESVMLWKDLGIKRVILARELSYAEIEKIVSKVGTGIEFEIFIHGAMCVSYSGRCLLSNFFSGRDSNRGECNQPCRWKYYLVEESKIDQLYEIVEEKRGSYILNSRDLCLIDRIEDIMKLGIKGYKVEGRTKNTFYVSMVAFVYRKAIDNLLKGKGSVNINYLKSLIELTNNHGFTHGFLFPDNKIKQNVSGKSYRRQNVLGYVVDTKGDDLLVKVKNPINVGDYILGINPNYTLELKVMSITTEYGEHVKKAYGARGDVVFVKFDSEIKPEDWEYGILSKLPEKSTLEQN